MFSSHFSLYFRCFFVHSPEMPHAGHVWEVFGEGAAGDCMQCILVHVGRLCKQDNCNNPAFSH